MRVGGSRVGPTVVGLVAIAMCGRGPKLKAATKTVPIVGETASTATAKCTGERHLVFGGFRHSAIGGGTYLTQLARKSGRAWSARSFSFAADEVTSIAYCG